MVIYNTPRIIYLNPGKNKALIKLENLGKSGIYIWTNLTNGKSYVGSGKELGHTKKGRLSRYFWNSRLKKVGNNSIIDKALLKYGHNNFILGILEYCPKE